MRKMLVKAVAFGLLSATISVANAGSKNGMWNGGSSFAPYDLKFTRKLKNQIIERDEFKCKLCPEPQLKSKKTLSVHHIDYNKQNSVPGNLIALCNSCHSKTNTNREKWIKHFTHKLSLTV